MNKNPLLAFVLSFVPGLGHLYLDRFLRAFLYACGFFGPLTLIALILLANNRVPPTPGLFLLFISVVVGIVNMIDMLVTLLSPNSRYRGFRARGYAGGYGIGPGSGTPEDGMQARGVNGGGVDHAAAAYDPYAAARMQANIAQQNQNERFFTIILSFIPGLGHFQLGLMQRGLTFLIGFFGLFAMITFVSFVTRERGFFVFLLALPVILFYGLFDAVQLHNRKQRGEVLVDRTVFEDFDMHRESGRKSKMVALFLAIFPGAGHMYLGLQRRGLQLMAAFLLAIYLMDALRLSIFLYLIPILWFFSLFDVMQFVSKPDDEKPKDVPLVGWLMNYQRWVGFGLLAIGAYYLLDRAIFGLIQEAYPDWRIVMYWFERYAQIVIVSVIFIVGGLKLMLGSKSNRGGERS